MIQIPTRIKQGLKSCLIRLKKQSENKRGASTLGLEQVGLLRDLLKMDMDNEGIQDILGIDLNNPDTIQTLIKKESTYYRVLCKACSKREGLEIILSAKELRLRTRALVIKQCAYPTFLLGLSLVLMTILGLWILPGLFRMIHTMVQDTNSSQLKIMQFVIGVEWSSLVCMVMYLGFIYPRESLNNYLWISCHFKGNIWKIWVSSLFLLDFDRLIQAGFNLADILEMMRNIGHPILRSLMRNTQIRMKSGVSISEAFEHLDEGLLRLMRIQESERKIAERLETYRETLGRLLSYKLNIIAKSILVCAYVQIAIVILIAYQMMFYPLKLLEAL